MRENLTLADLPPMGQEEKEWWDEHNFEYYHYFYRIDDTTNGMFYYGIHSERFETGKKPEEDGYMGSGADLKKAQDEIGLDKFTKTVIKTFSTRDEARLEEMIVVDEDMVNNPMCYNMITGGGCVPTYLLPTKGFAVVNYKDINLRKDKMFLVTSEEYEANKDKYITISSEKVLVNFKDPERRLEKFFQISKEEFEINKNIYVAASNGTTIYRNIYNSKDIRRLSVNDPLVLSGNFIAVNKGLKQSKETVLKKTGEKNGRYGTRWITNGVENKIISINDDLPAGWNFGRTVKKNK